MKAGKCFFAFVPAFITVPLQQCPVPVEKQDLSCTAVEYMLVPNTPVEISNPCGLMPYTAGDGRWEPQDTFSFDDSLDDYNSGLFGDKGFLYDGNFEIQTTADANGNVHRFLVYYGNAPLERARLAYSYTTAAGDRSPTGAYFYVSTVPPLRIVSLTATPSTIQAGAFTTITVTVAGGILDFYGQSLYQISSGSAYPVQSGCTSGGGNGSCETGASTVTFRDLPPATTTYTVTVTDAAWRATGGLQGGQAQASVTVTVSGNNLQILTVVVSGGIAPNNNALGFDSDPGGISECSSRRTCSAGFARGTRVALFDVYEDLAGIHFRAGNTYTWAGCDGVDGNVGAVRGVTCNVLMAGSRTVYVSYGTANITVNNTNPGVLGAITGGPFFCFGQCTKLLPSGMPLVLTTEAGNLATWTWSGSSPDKENIGCLGPNSGQITSTQCAVYLGLFLDSNQQITVSP